MPLRDTLIIDEAGRAASDPSASIRHLPTGQPRAGLDEAEHGALCLLCWQMLSDAALPVCPDCGGPRPPGGWGQLPHRFLAQFEFLRLVGRGAMGAVFLAVDLNAMPDAAGDRPTLAVKVVQQGGGEDWAAELARMFEHEAGAAALLGRTPSFVRVVGHGTGAVPYLAMEYVPWPTLASLMAGGPMRSFEVGRLGLALLGALEEMHFFRVVHRDLKPANIFFSSEGTEYRVKIADLGIWTPDSDAAQTGQQGEAPRMIYGTLSYMSPEQMAARPVGCRSDLHAVGSVLWEAATGSVPFPAHEQDIQARLATRRGLVERVPPRPKEMHADLYDILARALALAPEDRWESATAMLVALRTFVERCASEAGWCSEAVAQVWGDAWFSDRYEVQDLLGTGSWSHVYRARQHPLGHTVAVKRLCPLTDAGLGADQQLRLFLAQAQAACVLHHPNTVRILDAGVASDGMPFVALEHLQGETLEERLLREGAQSEAAACRLLAPVASALAEAHALDVLHLNLKPKNVLVQQLAGRCEVVKVLAFGWTLEHLDSVVPEGMILGTPRYMAPEQVVGPSVGPAADLYSVGALLYAAAVGRPPHDHPAVKDVLLAKLHHDYEPLPEGGPSGPLSPAFRAVVHALLARDPDPRPQEAADVASWLETLARGTQEGVPVLELRARAEHRR